MERGRFPGGGRIQAAAPAQARRQQAKAGVMLVFAMMQMRGLPAVMGMLQGRNHRMRYGMQDGGRACREQAEKEQEGRQFPHVRL
jgi:hypothetical protein